MKLNLLKVIFFWGLLPVIENDLAKVEIEVKWGYIDKSVKYIIEPKFKDINYNQ